jgi:hypothetical protein
VGYYETAKFLFDWFGSSLIQIRDICVGMGAAAATGIGALVLFLFPEHLSRRVRLFTSAFVLFSPVLWKLAQYGNTALPSCFWVIAAFVMTRFQNRWGNVAAVLLWGIGASYRADAILVAPALAACFMFRDGGRLRNGILGLIACGCVFVGIELIVKYGAGVSGASDSLIAVMFNTTQRGHHLTYVFWGIGPVILALVAAGWPTLARTWLWKVLAVWAAAPFVFYFAWSTTPRYYMLLVVPAAIVAALGFDALWNGLKAAAVWLRWPARVLSVAIVLAPLNFTLSEALPGDLNDWQTPQMYQTGDRPHYYGALLNDHRAEGPVPRPADRRRGSRTRRDGHESRRQVRVVDRDQRLLGRRLRLVVLPPHRRPQDVLRIERLRPPRRKPDDPVPDPIGSTHLLQRRRSRQEDDESPRLGRPRLPAAARRKPRERCDDRALHPQRGEGALACGCRPDRAVVPEARAHVTTELAARIASRGPTRIASGVSSCVASRRKSDHARCRHAADDTEVTPLTDVG